MAKKQAPIAGNGLIISSGEVERLRSQGHQVSVLWGGDDKPWFEWQKNVLRSTVDEIGLFGGKASGKSVLMRGWLVSGNPHLPDHDEDGSPLPFNQSYTYHPDYYGLILRKNQKDLTYFMQQAQRMWSPLGGEFKNGGFEFPSGARIDCGHMDTEDAWHKYIGNEYQRVSIDEAGLIADYGPIEELRSCMRTPNPELRIQIMYASNSGGPGSGWIMARFMKVKGEDGRPIPHDTVIHEKRVHPFTGEEEERTRIWVFATIDDNPIMRTTRYASDLKYMGDQKRVNAYFHGNWDALYGAYFGDLFRPEGPRKENNEPDNARHVVPAATVTLQPWFHRSIGMDWGYSHEAAVIWAARTPEKRVILYDELVVSKTSPETIGYEIAQRSRAALEKLPSHSMVLHLSHDAYNTRAGAKTIAELIHAGIARVLGPTAVHLPDMMEKNLRDSYAADAHRPEAIRDRDNAIQALRLQRRMGITIRKAEKTGVIGWQHCRELMRWAEIGQNNAIFDNALFMRLLQENPDRAEEYARLYRDAQPEALPKLQLVAEGVPRLIDALPRAQHKDGTENIDDAHFMGKDSVDALSYLVTGLRDENPPEPFEAYLAKQISALRAQHPEATTPDLIRANVALEAQWKEKNRGRQPATPIGQARLARMKRTGKWNPRQYLDRSLDNVLGLAE